MDRHYTYVGPRELEAQAGSAIPRLQPNTSAELSQWLKLQGLKPPVTLTFVVTLEGHLRVSPRHAEHVACAEGRPVLAAGEIEFVQAAAHLRVASLTNQSTGYCPEPDCFRAVAASLRAIGIAAPECFSHDFIFRRCERCLSICIVKELDFSCPSCSAALPAEWNFAQAVPT